MYGYRAYNLLFLSELEMPELEEAEGTPDVTICLGSVPLQLRDCTVRTNFFQASPDEFLYKLEKTAAYYVKNGSEITIEPYMDVNAPDIRLFLLGSVFGVLLHQRGYLVLHGASVVIGGRGVLITGKSGIGKSTLAAALYKKGYAILTDDVCAVRIGADGTPYITPGFPSLKLWRDAAEKLETSTEGLEPVKRDMEKHRVSIRAGYCTDTVRLDEIYELNAYDGSNVKLEPVRNMAKLETLIRNTYRYRFVSAQDMRSQHFRQCAAAAGKIHVFTVLRPKDGYMLDKLADAVEGNVAGHE
ncbi:MAG: hypothetical protein VB070_05830 [Clostridiaceae bacterium]|nr:hypothetical protein [Clostridiaceae bacterium]